MIQEIILFVCLLLTLISTGMLIAYFILKEEQRTYSFKLVLPIFVFDFIWALNVAVPMIYYFVSPDSVISEFACNFQGIVKLFTTNGSFFSALAISWTLYTFLIRKVPIQTKNPIIYFSGYTIVLPLIISFIPLFFNRYGYIQPIEQVMCFLILDESPGQTDYLGIIFRTSFYYMTFIIVLFLDIYYVGKICCRYYQNRNNEQEQFPKEVRNLALYPSILLLSWIWLIAERVIESLNGGNEISWLNKFDLHFVALNGFLNAIVYGYLSINPFSICYEETESQVLASKDSLINLNSMQKSINKIQENVSEISNSVNIKLKEDYDDNDISNIENLNDNSEINGVYAVRQKYLFKDKYSIFKQNQNQDD
ncbi:hypothetical protein ABPG74_012801 [Tetrahymena malaccensis]